MHITDDNIEKTGNPLLNSNTFGKNFKEEFKEVDLRGVFIKNYGVEMEMPAYSVHQAKLVPHHKDLIVSLAWHILPNDKSQVI
jgi:hypothetical protein